MYSDFNRQRKHVFHDPPLEGLPDDSWFLARKVTEPPAPGTVQCDVDLDALVPLADAEPARGRGGRGARGGRGGAAAAGQGD